MLSFFYRLLDPKFNGLFDNYRRFYADILFRWGLLEARILVLKYLSTPTEAHRGVDFVTECSPCRQTVRGPQCSLCKRLLLNCVICRVVVKGTVCLIQISYKLSVIYFKILPYESAKNLYFN